MVLVSATLIVRNEAEHLPVCLSSMAGLVDEIVVVDTGSTDESRAVALAHGARVCDYKWRDDFSAARNHGIAQAQGQWVFYIDADERVRAGAAVQVREQLQRPGYAGWQVLLHPRPGFTPYLELRLFRRHPLIRFRDIIHENIWPGVRRYQKQHGGRIGRSGVILDHVGYEGDQTAKHERNLPLLYRTLRRNPRRVFCWCHVANIALALGRPDEAEDAWQRALDVVRRRRGLSRPEDCLPFAALIEWELRRGRDPGALLDDAVRRFPHNHQIQWLRGRTLIQRGSAEEAIAIFERLVAAGERDEIDRTAAYDRRLFLELAHEALATATFRLGRFAESRRWYERAAEQAPGRLDYRVKAALARDLAAGRPNATSANG